MQQKNRLQVFCCCSTIVSHLISEGFWQLGLYCFMKQQLIFEIMKFPFLVEMNGFFINFSSSFAIKGSVTYISGCRGGLEFRSCSTVLYPVYFCRKVIIPHSEIRIRFCTGMLENVPCINVHTLPNSNPPRYHK